MQASRIIDGSGCVRSRLSSDRLSAARVPGMRLNRVAVLQSNYIPWKGYFDIIHDVDLFVFYDDVQYTKNDWRNRNRIKTANGLYWLTVPTGSDIERRICDVRLPDARWAHKHWKTLQQAYSPTPHFHRYEPFFRHVYLEKRWESLSQLNQYLIKAIARDHLGLKTRFDDSRNYAVGGAKFDRLLNLLIELRAEVYVSGPSAHGYIDVQRMEEHGIELVFKTYDRYPEYSQRFPPFEHAVSILDLLFNVGPDAPEYIWGYQRSAL
jgi:hypothetical protein